MPNCFVYGCSNYWTKGLDNRCYSRIPQSIAGVCYDIAGRADLKREEFINGDYVKYRICDYHFEDSDYDISKTGRKKGLKPNAVPYRFGAPSKIGRSKASASTHGSKAPSTVVSEPYRMIEPEEPVTFVDTLATGFLASTPSKVAPVALELPRPSNLWDPETTIKPESHSVDKACQTDPVSFYSFVTSNPLMDNHGEKSDHTYSKHWLTPFVQKPYYLQKTRSAETVETTAAEPSAAGLTRQSHESTSAVKVEPRDFQFEEEPESYLEDTDVDPEDMNFSANVSNMIVSSSEELISEDGGDSKSSTMKHIVYQTSLSELISRICCKCGGRYRNLKFNTQKGTLLVVNGQCALCEHKFQWRSQPFLGRKAKGNAELCAAIFLTGQTYSAISKVFQFANIQWMSKTLFYDYQTSHILPAIEKEFSSCLTRARQVVINQGGEIRLAGDGRYDSPGYSARYLTYTMMDSNSGLVTHTVTRETAYSSSSNTAEKDGFVECLAEAKTCFPLIDSITTDANLSIRAHMAKNESSINHGLDVWHLNKNIAKNLAKKATKKNQKPVLQWTQHLTNHVWWAAKRCNRDSNLLTEMVTSMRYHVVNKHSEFFGLGQFTKCSHGEIPSDILREVNWLVPGDPAHKVLVDYLASPNFISQLKQTAHGTHTGQLESLHSLILTYASKRIDFDPRSYKGRVALAIMDHNENISRPVKQDPVTGEIKYNLVWSKAVKGYRLRKIYQEKTYEFRENLMKVILDHAQSTALDTKTARYTGERISRGAPKPSLEEAKEAHLPRL